MEFEWDVGKAQRNLAKHGVSFEEAQTVLDDPLFVTVYDSDHSEGEARFVVMGESARRRLLVISYTDRGEKFRLISSREATPTERRAYGEG